MDIYHIFLIIAGLLDLVCIVAVIFLERKNPASTLAWILVLIFLPVLGFLAYMAFGSGLHIRKKKRFLAKASRDALFDKHLSGHLNIPPAVERRKDYPASPTYRLITYLEAESDGIYTPGNRGEVFYNGNDMFERLKADMRQAKSHIHVLFYIFKNDRIGREILEILEMKAKEGVEVRLMYDGLGTFKLFSRMFRGLKRAGGKVLPFSPILLNLSVHMRVNYRNHRKITVIDGEIGYVGGMNVGDEYLGRDKKLTPWRDTHLRFTGPAVWFLQERFFMDWLYANETDPAPQALVKYFPPPLMEPPLAAPHTGSDLGVQIVSSGADTQEQAPIKSGLMTMIYNAMHEVLLQTPYFVPDESFLDALRIAAGSGVAVKLMLPSVNDNLLVHRANFSFARQVMEYGVKVYLYNGFLHAKTLTCDRHSLSIGSCNFDIRSFSLNFEVNAFIHDHAFARAHARQFEKDLANCVELTPDWMNSLGWHNRVISRLARLFAPLM